MKSNDDKHLMKPAFEDALVKKEPQKQKSFIFSQKHEGPNFQPQSEKPKASKTAKQKQRKRRKAKWLEQWSPREVKRVFQLFDRHGSNWRFFNEQIPNRQRVHNRRSVNSIKNRFYTALRNTFKLLFKNHPQIVGGCPYEIPSKELVRLYESREHFAQYSGFAKAILEEMEYETQLNRGLEVIQKYSQQILKIHDIIFKELKSNSKPESSPNQQSIIQPQQPVNQPQNAQNLPQQSSNMYYGMQFYPNPSYQPPFWGYPNFYPFYFHP